MIDIASEQPMQKQFFSVTRTVGIWVDIDPSWDEEQILAEARYQACVSVSDWCGARVHRAKETFRWPRHVWYIRQFLKKFPALTREIATYVE